MQHSRSIVTLLTIVVAVTVILSPSYSVQAENSEETFKAKVVEVLENTTTPEEEGSSLPQQKLQLQGLSGSWAGKSMVFDGTKFEVVSASQYEVGDVVMVSVSADPDGNNEFFVVDYVRQNSLYWLAIIFALVVVAVGRLKGLRALVVLLLTFLVIQKFIVPRILAGDNPLVISILGALVILGVAIYITEGFKRSSTVAIGSVLVSLIITGVLSIAFTAAAKLTGFVSEEAIYLKGLAGVDINIHGLLLAGIIIGTLGVLDDVIISQVVVVEELKRANRSLTNRTVFAKAMRVGIGHMSALVNTLFLAYAGASLPLLLLFSVREEPFLTFSQVINNDMIATEIVRTLTGSIGIVLAVPIATALAVKFIHVRKGENVEGTETQHRH